MNKTFDNATAIVKIVIEFVNISLLEMNYKLVTQLLDIFEL